MLGMKDDRLTIDAEWEALAEGRPEEVSGYAALSISVGNRNLTEAEDYFAKRTRESVYLSAYDLAEWFAWNWWRLRWEPYRVNPTADWCYAHKMASIGKGYVWPNIRIWSDGERIALLAQPTSPNPKNSLRYLADWAAVIPAGEYEKGVEQFVQLVLDKLLSDGVANSNLAKLWAEISEERTDPCKKSFRLLEALLGYDAGEGDEAEITRLLEDGKRLGSKAVGELAVDGVERSSPPSYQKIKEIAQTAGVNAKVADAVRLGRDRASDLPTGVVAWKKGVAAARLLRDQEHLGEGSICDKRLADMAGVDRGALNSDVFERGFSFSLEKEEDEVVVFASRHRNSRRFTLARLIGDRIASSIQENLRPMTSSGTFRQKMQRAFAGEFLCPFNSLAAYMQGDFSDEAIIEAAQEFDVSELTVKTLLMNHGKIEREDPDSIWYSAA